MTERRIIFSLEIFKEGNQNWKHHYEINTDGNEELMDNLFIVTFLELLHNEILENDVEKFVGDWKQSDEK